MSSLLLDVRDLTVEFPLGRQRPPLRAVDGVSLTIAPRETLGLVGESGSGKTTIGRAILGLVPVARGTIQFAGADITSLPTRARRSLSAELQVVFQDPYSSLNPARTVGQTLSETLRVHEKLDKDALAARVRSMLEQVGLPGDAARRFPSQFSGGQRQRIAIARALMVHPRLVICDEPLSALDVSVQAQVVNVLQRLQHELELSYLFISHDLAVVRRVAQRIVVLYRGRVMEQGPAEAVYSSPAHPYTRALLAAAPVPNPDEQRRRRSERAASTTFGAPAPAGEGCPFAARCPHALDVCRTTRPALETNGSGSLVACHRWRELQSEETPAAVRAHHA
jgi:oligopeptide/dipeptide ABC transporter ATP-binding protein